MPADAATDVADEAREIPLPSACLRLRINRERLLRALFDGRLSGRQIHGRWVVSLDSIERWGGLGSREGQALAKEVFPNGAIIKR